MTSISTHPRRQTRRPPAGAGSDSAFTVVELVIVLVIVGALMAAGWTALQGAQRQARARAQVAAATEVGRAVSTFNRMRPPVAASDPLVAGATWTSTQSEAQGGLYSTTGERLLVPWPSDPYTGRPIVVRRAAACPATGTIGQISVCRVTGGSATAFRVRAWGKARSGAPYMVYDQTFG